MGARVYFGNLPPTITERDLEGEAGKFGTLRSVWVARKPPGFAFIEFDDRRDADDAVRKLDGHQGWRVELARAPDRGPYSARGPPGGGGGGYGGGGGGYGGGGGGGGYGGGGGGYGGGGGGGYSRDVRERSPPRHRGRSPPPARRRSPSYEPARRRSPSYSPRPRRSPSYARSRSPARRSRSRS